MEENDETIEVFKVCAACCFVFLKFCPINFLQIDVAYYDPVQNVETVFGLS